MAGPTGSAESLLGRRVALLLLEPLAVAPSRRGGPPEALPAGMYAARLLRLRGGACLAELCDRGCGEGHCWAAARILQKARRTVAA